MQHLKIFEDYNGGNNNKFLMNIYKNGIANDKQDFIKLALDKGFDVKINEDDLISWALETVNYNSVRYFNKEWYDHMINTTSSLDISNKKINSLKGLSDFVNLKTINCSGNNLIDLKGLENMNKLESIWCSDNQIETLDAIVDLPYLEQIYFHNNNVSDISKLMKRDLNGFNCTGNPLPEVALDIWTDTSMLYEDKYKAMQKYYEEN